MITSFKHKGLREFYETNSKKGVPPELASRLRDRLDVIDAASNVVAEGGHLWDASQANTRDYAKLRPIAA